MRIENCVALVTGANRGLGSHLVAELVDRGAARVYAAARDPRTITRDDVRALALDITDGASVAAAAAAAPDVTLLVNNAGVAHAQGLVTGDPRLIRDEMETNAFGTLWMVRAFAPVLARGGGGAVLNVLSAASWLAYPGNGAYAMSKAAAWSLTAGVRAELAAQGTQVTGVHVGMIDTEMSAPVTADKLDPAEVARQALDGLANGALEVLVGERARWAKAALAGPPRVGTP